MTLSLYKVSVPFFKFPKVLFKQKIEVILICRLELPCFGFFNESEYGKKEGGRIHLEDILVDKLDFRHE